MESPTARKVLDVDGVPGIMAAAHRAGAVPAGHVAPIVTVSAVSPFVTVNPLGKLLPAAPVTVPRKTGFTSGDPLRLAARLTFTCPLLKVVAFTRIHCAPPDARLHVPSLDVDMYCCHVLLFRFA
jgi:hypothetical protein